MIRAAVVKKIKRANHKRERREAKDVIKEQLRQ